MTHTYSITGMTCTSCQSKVQGLLSNIDGVKNVSINLQKGIAQVEMSKHIAINIFKTALQDYPKYQINEAENEPAIAAFAEEETKTWLATYKPILLIFAYITITAFITTFHHNTVHWMDTMRIFMSGFFLIFSFFKMLDLSGFAESYAMYDVVAKKLKSWGFIYAFLELALGIAYAINFQPFVTNVVTLIVMTVSIIGVLQSLLNKRKIKCACLGAVFNLPMSTVTIFEDVLMIAMSAVMILSMV